MMLVKLLKKGNLIKKSNSLLIMQMLMNLLFHDLIFLLPQRLT